MTASQPHRIRTLDGWRGVAILLVIAGTARISANIKISSGPNLWGLGGDIFFVLSGYIITPQVYSGERKVLDHQPARLLHPARLPHSSAGVRLPGNPLRGVPVRHLLDFHSSEVFGSLFSSVTTSLPRRKRGFYTHSLLVAFNRGAFLLAVAGPVSVARNRRSLWFAGIGACACATWRLYDCTHPDSWIGRFCPARQFLSPDSHDARFDGLLLGCALAILLSREPCASSCFATFPKEAPLFAAVLLGLKHSKNEWLAHALVLPDCFSYGGRHTRGRGGPGAQGS